METQDSAHYDETIQDIDRQIRIRSEKKEQLSRKNQDLLPNGLDKVMQKKEKRRNRNYRRIYRT